VHHPDDEDEVLRSVATQNAKSILQARQRAENELIATKEALEGKTRELAQSLAMMRATLEATTDGILVTGDGDGVIDYNRRYAEMWGIPLEVVAARNRRPLLEAVANQCVDPRAFLARVREIDAQSPSDSFDVLELADGRTYERSSRLQVVDGRKTGRVWSFHDATERRRAEDAAKKAAAEREVLLESERHARAAAEHASFTKDEFLATLSHELRTPLSSILGWSQVLRGGGRSAQDLEKGLDVIERNARIQTKLIEDLLDMSRILSGKVRLDVQPVDPIRFVEAAIETLRPAAEAKGIRLEELLDPRAGPVSGDPSRLQQVVWNLLSNAIKFTPKEGKVQVLLERVNSHIEISVADTGIGIEPAFIGHVFERFRQQDASTTRSYGGLGLGLSIVKHLVELHGGAVRAQSDGKGKGATFSVQLPLVVVHRASAKNRFHPETRKDPTSEIKVADLVGIKVLVVDDQVDARNLVARVLTDSGALVLTAGTADEALAIVEQERPNVLVSDIGMPQVDGYELLRRVRALGGERGGNLPAVALTAFARSEDRTRALRAGFLVHVSKPVEPSELIATVASVAGRVGA
jgi:signal transduction histidine kinase/ActR/RegA family two-component response regulator